jgi:uncharacterized protein YfiM (DUF2279 family)
MTTWSWAYIWWASGFDLTTRCDSFIQYLVIPCCYHTQGCSVILQNDWVGRMGALSYFAKWLSGGVGRASTQSRACRLGRGWLAGVQGHTGPSHVRGSMWHGRSGGPLGLGDGHRCPIKTITNTVEAWWHIHQHHYYSSSLWVCCWRG